VYCGGSNVGVEDDIAEHTSVEMLMVDGFIEAVIGWHTVCQQCQYITADTSDTNAADTVTGHC